MERLRAVLDHWENYSHARLGRLFIVLCLMDRGRLPGPLLHYDRLQLLRGRGESAEWLRLFLEGGVEQAQRDAPRQPEPRRGRGGPALPESILTVS